MIFKQPDEVYTSKYIERTPHYIYFTTWSLINLRSSGLLSAISIAYESNCSATCLSGELAASFSIKDSKPECKDSLLPVSGGYPQLPNLTQHPSGLQELHALLHHLVQDGQDGQYVGLHLCIRLHLERKQRWLSELEGESKIELRTSSEHLQKLGNLVLNNNSWWQFQNVHLELRIIDPVNQVKGFKASVITRIAAHTWIQFLILEGSLVNNWSNHVMTITSTNIMSITGTPA